MKVKVLSRNLDEYLRETKKDIHKVPRNYDPKLHPMSSSREYVRALNAVKLERVFAKPFLGSLDGHKDGISCMSKHPQKLSLLFSGACDGEVKIWNIPRRQCVKTYQAHEGYVRGLCFNSVKGHFFSCGDDKLIKIWSLDSLEDAQDNIPLSTIIGKSLFGGMDHHRADDIFATCGQYVEIWNEDRMEPVTSYNESHTSYCVKFNPSEMFMAAATLADRSIVLYDIRAPQRIRKTIMTMSSNSLAWNPMEPFYFTVANEDYNLYSYDMRKMDAPYTIHKDHVSAVMDVDYSPTGKEFVAGSYDKSLRIFPALGGHSRDVYHTKRMQRIACVQWSLDSKFIFSASEEMIVRVWKANASEKLGVLKPREKEAFNYASALKTKYANHPQVRRIARHRHVPGHIFAASKEHKIIHFSQKKKEANRRVHSKPGEVPFVREKEKKVVAEVE